MRRAYGIVLTLASTSPACGGGDTPSATRSDQPMPVSTEPSPDGVLESAPTPGKSPEQIAATVKAAMDPSADPCGDFYQYACGGWIAATALPADQSRWTRSFGVLREQNRALMHEILEDAAKTPGQDDAKAKLGRYYASCMNEPAIDAAKATVLEPLFARVASVEDAESFMTVAGALHTEGIRPLFGLRVGPDDKNPGINIAHIGQGGLGLPDRDYYLDTKRADILSAYREHTTRMFELLGEDQPRAAAIAADVVAFETSLAKVQMTRVERRDPDKTYNKIDRAGIEARAPGLAWPAFAEASGHPEITAINVDSPAYLEAAARILAKAPPSTLRNYLKWTILRDTAESLSSEFVNENFAFYGKTLRGQQENEARWKRCTSATDGALPHPLGRLYVERAFAGESKNIALDLIGRIEAAFEHNLPQLAWMSETTRVRAMEKVKAIHNKIGYPEKWRDYAGLAVGEQWFANTLAAARFEFEYRAAQVGKPVDRDEWRAGPPVVNASYSGTRNEMWFPAGILQAPFFDKDHPMAMNFGGIGVVMGHELTHGFDDQGRKYDASGMLQQWWEDEVITQFEQRTRCVDELYSAQEVEPGLPVNGKLTLGENTADMGGVKQAFAAYRKWAEENDGDTEPHVEGLTNDQLLFVSFAQVWCTVATPEYLRVQVATDPHSPARFRANVPLSMTPAFAEAFACAKGTPMRPDELCEVW